MIYRNWQTYQDALATYNAAKTRHEAVIRAWNENLARFDKNSSQWEAVNSGGCLAVVIAAAIAVYNGVVDRHWGAIIIYGIIFAIYSALDEKCLEFQKSRYIATVPCPRFTLEEPSYEPPSENYHPPSPAGANLTLDAALSILGLTRQTTLEQVKQAYRDRIREYHPDKVSHLGSELRELAERKAKEINAAYECVSKAFQGRSRT